MPAPVISGFLTPPFPSDRSGTAAALSLSLLFLWPLAGRAATEPEFAAHIILSTPRNSGYVVGDVIHHQLQISPPAGYVLEQGSLPRAGAYNDFLEIRRIRLEESGWFGAPHYQLSIDYQLFRGVTETEQLAIPGLHLRFQASGNSTPEAPHPGITTAAWPFSMAPMIPRQTTDEEVVLHPPMPLPAADTEVRWQQLTAGLLCLLLGTGMIARKLDWLTMLNWRPGPFRLAYRRIRHLRRQHGQQPDAVSRALRILHSGFNETADQVVLSGGLKEFFSQHPQYQSRETAVETFFALSRHHFFAAKKPRTAPAEPLAWLERLARDLSLMEKH